MSFRTRRVLMSTPLIAIFEFFLMKYLFLLLTFWVLLSFSTLLQDICLIRCENEFIQQMASDLMDYRQLIDDFSAKYGANADAADYVSDYSKIADKAEELEEKYTKIDSEKLYGSSSEEILSFYDKVEELKNAFAEEK